MADTTNVSSNMYKRVIETRITLDKEVFNSNNNQKIIRELTSDVQITKVGGKERDKATIVINGMLQDDISRLTTLSYKPLQVQKNRIEVWAGYDKELSLVFSGDIKTAQADFSNVNSPMAFECQTGHFIAAKALPPTHQQGSVRADMLFKRLANQAGLSYKNVNVNSAILNPVLQGSAIEQIQDLANQLQLQVNFDSDTLVVAKRGSVLHSGNPLLSVDTGLLGYPVITEKGLKIRCRFNPSIKFGGCIILKSESPIANKINGIWKIFSLKTHLQNNAARWEQELECSPL